MTSLKSEIRNQKSEIRLVIGCMTGTSLDGLDAALVEIAGHGLEMKAKFVAMTSLPLGDLREELRHFASGGAAEPLRFMRAARRLGELHAQAVADLCAKSQITDPKSQINYVVAHGQTIWHAPDDRTASKDAGLSFQLFDPWPIVRRIGVPVCYDLRQADLIAGGQGAPITPISDWVMYRSDKAGRLIINLGGICNTTRLIAGGEPDTIDAGDVGPCNLLIDGVVRQLFPGQSFDMDGRIAMSVPESEALDDLGSHIESAIREHPYFSTDASTGREDFSDAWVNSLVARFRSLASPAEIVAASVLAVAAIINLDSFPGISEVVLAGGGARNPALVRAISRCAFHDKVITSDALGIPIEAREAMGFAVLGALSQDGVPITLPAVTGAVNPGRAGAWVYP